MRCFALCLISLIAAPAFADGDGDGDGDASWEAFRKGVANACRALVQGPGKTQIEVIPFGSESYGAALVDLVAPAETDRMDCIHDKVTKKAELSAPFLPKTAN